jgi:hypothetical protein
MTPPHLTKPRRQRPIAALAILCLAGGAHAQTPTQPETIKPGYWESNDRLLSPIPESKIDHRCIAQKDVQKFMSCYINHHYTCDCPDQSFIDGKIKFHGVCVDKKGAQVKIEGDGDYTPTTLHMNAQAVFRMGGLPILARASLDAHRLGDVCPPEPAKK